MSTAEKEELPYVNPLRYEPGLPDNTHKHLVRDLKSAEALERERRMAHRSDYSRTFGREINEWIEEIQDHKRVKRTGKAAVKHYRLNEGAYQVQAVKDAAAEGVYTNFSHES
jgi:hypothetical protein